MDIQFKGLSAAIPDGWSDASTLVYLMPSDLKAEGLPTTKPVKGRSPASITIKWEALPKQSLNEYLTNRMAELSAILTAFEAGAMSQGEDMAHVEYAFEQGEKFRQLMVVKKVGEQLVCLTGTTSPERFESLKGTFLDAGKSITTS